MCHAPLRLLTSCRSLRSWTLSLTVSSEHVAAGAPSIPSAMRHVFQTCCDSVVMLGFDRSLLAVACIAGSAHGTLLGHGARLTHAQAPHAAATKVRRVAESGAHVCLGSVVTAPEEPRNVSELSLLPAMARTLARSAHGVQAMEETTSWHRGDSHAHRTRVWVEGHGGGVASLGAVKGEGSRHGSGGASAGRGAARRGGRGSGGGGGRGGGAARPVTFTEWAADVERLCAQRSPPGGHLYSAAARLADVPCRTFDHPPSRERAVHLVAKLLRHAVEHTDMHSPRILLAASSSLRVHDGLLQVARKTPALLNAAQLRMRGAVKAEGTWADSLSLSQLAVAQQRLNLYFEPFWQRLSDGVAAQLGVRQATNVLHAYATLMQAGNVPTVDEPLCRRLAVAVASERKERAVAQAIANTLWALGILGVVPDAQVLATLHSVAVGWREHEVRRAGEQHVTGAAKLGQPVWRRAAEGAAGCCPSGKLQSRSMIAQDVANNLWALSELGWCRPDAPAVPAVAALHAAAQQRAADMNSQGVSNTLLALARLRNPVSDALQATLLLAIERIIAVGNEVATSQHVANTLWSLSQLRWQRAAKVSEALLEAAQRVAGSMTAKGVASSLLALATLQWPLRHRRQRRWLALHMRGCRR